MPRFPTSRVQYSLLACLSLLIHAPGLAQSATPSSDPQPAKPEIDDSDSAPQHAKQNKAAKPDAKGEQRYTFKLEARDDLQVVLMRYLELVRRQYDADVDLDSLAILVDRSQRQARSLLATEGYFSPQVDVAVDPSAMPWSVTMKVREGEPVRVTKYSAGFVGDTQGLAEAVYAERKLAARATIHEGDVFRQAPWDVTKNALLREYLTDTFPEARFTYTLAKIDPDTHSADLAMEIDAGKPFAFGPSRITGLSKFGESLITQVKQFGDIAVGTPWQQARLLDLQSALQTLPYFRSVVVTSDPAEAVDQQIPVEIRVTEARTQRIEFGTGFSTNTGARVQAAYSNNNFRARGLLFDTRLKLDQREQTFENSLRFPVRSDGWTDGISFNVKNSDIEGLRLASALLEAKRERKEVNFDRAFTLSYAYSVEDIAGVGTNKTYALYPGWSWTARQLDDITFPRKGYVANVQFAAGAAPLLSTATFFRTYAKAIGVIPVGSLDSLQLRLEGGAVLADDATRVPNDLRFRAGGDQSLRGYRYQSIGIQSGAAVVGARYLAIAGAEYSHWFSKTWGAGVFAESGDAFNQVGDFRPATGVGVGPRWRSPIGPVNIDLAYGLRDRSVRLHFSLGFVF